MNQPDEITVQLCEIARILESCGYAIEVDYNGATIIVWTNNWPVIVEVKNNKSVEEE